MTSLICFGSGAVLLLLAIWVRYVERKQLRQWFLSDKARESSSAVVDYLDKKRKVLSRMGWEVTRWQLVLVIWVVIGLMAALPLLFHESWILSAIFAGIGAVAFELGVRLYGLRFNIRFETGLRLSALPIGIESLTATGEAEVALKDILKLSRDKLMLREFQAVKSVMDTLKISCEEAIMIRAQELKVPAYLWLARYTQKMRQFGANTGEAWQDVLDELEDKDMLRTRVLAKTAAIRVGAYFFGVALVIALLLFFHLIEPLMKGMIPFIFSLIMISVVIGIYRLARLGGDVK